MWYISALLFCKKDASCSAALCAAIFQPFCILLSWSTSSLISLLRLLSVSQLLCTLPLISSKTVLSASEPVCPLRKSSYFLFLEEVRKLSEFWPLPPLMGVFRSSLVPRAYPIWDNMFSSMAAPSSCCIFKRSSFFIILNPASISVSISTCPEDEDSSASSSSLPPSSSY